MLNKLRVIALLSIVLLIAAACSKPKGTTAQVGGENRGAVALSEKSGPGKTTKGAAPGLAKSYNLSGQQKGYAALNPGADTAQARKVGQLIKIMSTSYKNPNTWTGVTKDTIKLAFGVDATNCGVNLFALLSNAAAQSAKETRFARKAPSDQDTINKESREAMQLVIRYWNDHVQDVAADSPEALRLMKKYNTPGHNFYGRKLVYDTVDAGSFQCADKQTSAAITMRDQVKPFSAVVYDVPGLYENGVGLASAMKAKIPADKRPMIFGLLDTSDKFLKSFAPYAWDEFASITKQSKLAASWMCADLAKTSTAIGESGLGYPTKDIAGNKGAWGNGKAVNAVDPGLRNKTRKFGLIYANNANSNQAAGEFKTFIKDDCGITFDKSSNEFQINDNPVRAADEGNQIATRFKLAGVTTVIYLIDFLGAFFHLIDYDQQGYRPELANIGVGWDAAIQRIMSNQAMVDRSMFYTMFGIQGVGYGPGDPFWVYHSYHKVSPKSHKACDPRTDAGMSHDSQYCKEPTAMGAWYYSWLPLVGGMIFAGPNLTPGNAAAGLQAYPLTRYGVDGPTSDPVAVLVGAGPGQNYFITDGSSARYRASFVSPPPERVPGWPDYPDCQRHYLLWPDQLAPQWEKNGPNYNGWCGNAKYAKGWTDQGKPVAYEPSAASGKKCSDLPAKKCESDNYPRWEPVLYR